MRVQFYVLQVLSRKKRAQTEGIIFNINLMVTKRNDKLGDLEFRGENFQILQSL
jgi:hypothetical protein